MTARRPPNSAQNPMPIVLRGVIAEESQMWRSSSRDGSVERASPLADLSSGKCLMVARTCFLRNRLFLVVFIDRFGSRIKDFREFAAGSTGDRVEVDFGPKQGWGSRISGDTQVMSMRASDAWATHQDHIEEGGLLFQHLALDLAGACVGTDKEPLRGALCA